MDGVAVATVQRALELGITHIDTSPLYEPSERRIGMALAEVEAPGLTISTKVGSHSGASAQLHGGGHPVVAGAESEAAGS